MPPDKGNYNHPEIWLRYARSDLAMAEKAPECELREQVASFHLQQCAEKAIKAVLRLHAIEPPYTHDIRRLLEVMDEQEIKYPEFIEDATELTGYAVHARYPTLGEAIELDEFEAGIQIARRVLDWASKIVQSESST